MPSHLVRPYRVRLQVTDPTRPFAAPMQHLIEVEAFDASDALLQAGIKAEGDLGLFDPSLGLTIKGLSVDPNVSVQETREAQIRTLAADATVLARDVKGDAMRLHPGEDSGAWKVVEAHFRIFFDELFARQGWLR